MEPGAKADKMKKKTDDMRRMFNLPDTESVIQDYACAQRKAVLVPGRMFISQNYICFYSGLPETYETIPFRKVTDIVRDRTALLFDNAINITSSTGIMYLGSFVHRDETLNLLMHLWKHPPSYFDIDETPSLPPPSANGSNSAGSGSSGANGTRTSGSGNPFDTNGSGSGSGSANGSRTSSGSQSQSGARGSGGQQQQQQVTVDTQASRNALRIALETREIGSATMNELSYQAEVIDLIERDVENIHNNMDKADRLIRGIESFGGSMANAFSSEKRSGRDIQYTDRTLVAQRVEMPVDMHILLKLSNDDLVPMFLRFTGDRFAVINPTTKKTEKDLAFPYEGIDTLVVRARPLHIDVRFKDKKKNRVRMMSSYVQSIVNEFCIRAKPKIGNLNVTFEPGTRKFTYGNLSIPLPSTESASGERKAAFFRKDGAATLPGVFKNASDDVKQGILQQEQDLTEISGVLGDLHGIATTMGHEIDRQSEQLDRVTNRVDLANDRINRNNNRINQML